MQFVQFLVSHRVEEFREQNNRVDQIGNHAAIAQLLERDETVGERRDCESDLDEKSEGIGSIGVVLIAVHVVRL